MFDLWPRDFAAFCLLTIWGQSCIFGMHPPRKKTKMLELWLRGFAALCLFTGWDKRAL